MKKPACALSVICGALFAACALNAPLSPSTNVGGASGSSETKGAGGNQATGEVGAAGSATEGAGGASGTPDPDWAEWRMPNSQVDVAAGAPNSRCTRTTRTARLRTRSRA
jgi:hypothetical protein